VRSVGVYEDSSPPDTGLHCELRDSGVKLIPKSADDLLSGSFTRYWIRLRPHDSVRLRFSCYLGYGGDGIFAVYLRNGEFWDVHPSKTNEYYLSGTFTPHVPTNETPASVPSLPNNMDAWNGTLTLPGVKIPMKNL